jgi:dTDP-4-amino-4,6-dideoxygalactose transaminase
VGYGVHYPIPIHLQEAYTALGYERGAFPVSEMIAGEVLSLPMYPELEKDQINFVIETVTEAVTAGVMV